MTSCKTIGYVIVCLVWGVVGGYVIVCLVWGVVGGCAGTYSKPAHDEIRTPKTSTFTERKTEVPRQDSRLVTSLNLTSIGERYIREGRYDDAISVLEKSVAVYAQNGENYYHLAEAWLRKGNFSLAREFNQLAAIYLKEDKGNYQRVIEQKRTIDKKISGS